MFEQEKDNGMTERMIRYFNQDISESELEALNQWLQESPANKESFFQLKDIHDVLRYHPQQSAEEAAKRWRQMECKITSSTVPSTIPALGKKTVFRSLKCIAIAVAASIIGFVFIHYYTVHLTSSFVEETHYHAIHVRKGSKPSSITLADGSIVQLNVASTLRYPMAFSTANREVYLDGEARFDIVKNDQKPFIVHLQHQTITVHGTSFNVEAYQDETSHKITLLSGSVSLETNNQEGELISQIYLKPGQKASFDIASGAVAVEQVDVCVADPWIQGVYKFKDESLAQIVKRLEKYYDVNIRLSDDLKNIRYTGTLSFNQRIEQVFAIINYDNKYTFQRNENSIYIAIK